MQDHILGLYTSLFLAQDMVVVDFSLIHDVISHLVAQEDNAVLTALPTYVQVKETISNMDKYSAYPGFDGFGALFYQHC